MNWTDPGAGESALRDASGRPVGLPEGYAWVRELARRGDQGAVVLAERRGELRVLRLWSGSGAGEQLAELAVLAAVEHPGLARLVDHGALPGGGSFVARAWIEGIDLERWASGRSPEEIGRAIARLCPALEHLHAAGFLHADLKATNVVVGAGDRPVLTDFGLARRSGRAQELASGSWITLAPEVLLGAAPDARADLFGLGAILYLLLTRRAVVPRAFYARFPHVDFFTAAGGAPAELPEWARDLVADLVAVDPARRPASALAVGRALAARLGIALEDVRATAAPRWRPLDGRGAWADELLDRLTARTARSTWIAAGEGEDPRALADELALRAVLAGRAVRRVDPARELAHANDAAALDRWATAEACAGDALRIGALAGGESWSRRALEALARALAQPPHCGALVLFAGAPPAQVSGVELVSLPPLALDAIEGALARELPEEDPARRGRLAALLFAASEGGAARLDRALAAAARAGWILPGARRWRLRPGELPLALEADGPGEAPADAAQRRALAALAVCGGRATLDELARTAGGGAEALAGAVAALAADRRVALERRAIGLEVALLARGRCAPEALAGAETWRALHAARGRDLAQRGASRAEQLVHLVRAGAEPLQALLDECAALRERGVAERALEVVELASGFAPAPEAALEAERAQCWCALGEFDRALEIAEPLGASGDARERASAERVRGQVALLRHEPERSLACFESALALDPHDGGEALHGKARLCFELRRDVEALALIEAARGPGSEVRPRLRTQLDALEALIRMRRGEIERARALLDAAIADAHAGGDALREAAACVNLATLERRTGAPERARRWLEAAAEGYERAGFLPGCAQARAQLGAALRDGGELAHAAGHLRAALELRERLGDRRGALAVRGMLGLVAADQGRAAAALADLGIAAGELARDGRSVEAALLEARQLEVRARLGLPAAPGADGGESARTAEGDPRILLALARAAALSGAGERALELARRARELGGSLGLRAVVDEAGFLERATTAAPFAPDAPCEDERLFALLGRRDLEPAPVRRVAEELAARGRLDRAARVFLALATRVAGGDADRRRARELLEHLCAGLEPAHARALELNLLGLPDPWPEDLAAWHRRDPRDEELEMEVMSLLEINHRLLAQESLASLLGAIVEQALSVSGAQRGFLVLEEQGELSFDTARDSRRGDIREPDLEVSRSILREALERMQPLRISNAAADPDLAGAPSVIALELRSILCVPFLVEAGLRGVIYLDHRLREGAFDERAERMLELLADQAALAILQVRRLDEIRRLNRELRGQVVHKESELRTARRALVQASLPVSVGGLVGSSPPMRAVHHLLERAANVRLAVLVTGASGTGKELAARALHALSQRGEGPFVSESCAALPANLIEAELFGAQRGAYTGAERDREGLIERAHGGTLFLDEVGELPLELQAKLLRVIETSQVRRLGENEPRDVDFRLVSATNRDLEEEVRAGRFRADLFFRLDGLRVRMPALAERLEDVPELVDHWLRMEEASSGVRRRIAPAVVARLARRAWPGNVRELFNELARLCAMCTGDVDDPGLVRESALGAGPVHAATGAIATLAELEREAILRALEATGGDKRKAAGLLGISRAKVYQRLKEWGADDGSDLAHEAESS